MSFVCWVNSDELSLIEAFPEVIMVDTTEKINNKNRPLLTVGDKDSNGKIIIFLKCFMPNQQSWMFRWILSVVFSRLIPKHVLCNTKIVITDGDPQEYIQIDNVIQNIIPNTKRIWCGWHIISQGFDKHVNTTSPDIPSSTVEKY